MVEIVMVHRQRREAVDSEGKVHPITDFINGYGEVTENPEAAVAAVVQGPDLWITLDLSCFDPATSQ